MHDEPLPLALITKMVKFRVRENVADAKAKLLARRVPERNSREAIATDRQR